MTGVLGTVTVAVLIAAAVRVAALGVWSAVLRAAILLAFAAFVWMRPGVKPPGSPALWYVAGLCVLAGAAYFLLNRPAISDRVARVLTRASATEALALALLAAVLALPAIITRLVAYWDVSGWMDSHSYDVFAMNIATGKAPAGNSSYMPVYQYGLAFIYYVFGHFFFVQQLVNGVLAFAVVVLLSLASWTLFDRSGAAALIAGVLCAYTTQFFAFIQTTQIETWYVPMICAVLLCWAAYWRRPSTSAAALLALAIGAALNTRNQGALTMAAIGMAPLLRPGLVWSTRLRHFVVIGALGVASLLPWTIRNASVDGRWSPFADRSAMYLGIYTDPRVGLYGVRYWEGWDEVAAEFQARYPNAADREKAYLNAAWRNTTSDPGRLGRALVVRSLSFYGLLPDGYLLLDRMEPPQWRDEWRRYLFSRTTPLLLLPLTLVAIAWRPTVPNLVLGIAAAAGVVIVIASAPTEDRASYPSLPIHILVVSGLFAAAPAAATAVRERPRSRSVALIAGAGVVAIVLAVVIRSAIGVRYVYRPLMERSTRVQNTLALDQSAPLLSLRMDQSHAEGSRVRARVMLSNYMFPPKYVGRVPSVPAFASDPSGPLYFYGYVVTSDEQPRLGPAVGVTFSGAEVSHQLREGDLAEVEAVVAHQSKEQGLWLRVDRARKLDVRPDRLPAFP